MRIFPISDLHVEFHSDGGEEFLARLPRRDVDLLIVAGDLADSELFIHVLERLSDLYPAVVYVHGNHECYGSSIAATKDAARKAAKRLKNVRFLSNDVAEIHGRRFLGTTMWFRPHPHAPLHGDRMNDWGEIASFASSVPQENAKALRFLNAEVSPGDIVVTHHAPMFRSVDPRWQRDRLSRLFYVCDQNDLIFDRRPALWVHGHVHHSWDYPVWGTRVVCNPVGYLDSDPNPNFDLNMIVEI